MRSSAMRCPPESATATEIAIPACFAFATAVSAIFLAPAWVRRFESATNMKPGFCPGFGSLSVHGGFLNGPRCGLFELHRAAAIFDADDVLRGEPAFEDLFRERVLDALLDRALERPRAVDRIEAGPGELREGAVSNFQSHLELREALLEVAQLDLRDVPDVLLVQGMEHDDLVDAVDELGPELRLHLRQDRGLDEAGIVALHLLDHVRAEVGGHHDHRLLYIHCASLSCGTGSSIS